MNKKSNDNPDVSLEIFGVSKKALLYYNYLENDPETNHFSFYKYSVIDQFAQGFHDRLVRRDVKRLVAQNRTIGLLCNMEVLEAAIDAA